MGNDFLNTEGQKKNEILLLKDFSSTLRKIPLYPPTHPMVSEAITRLSEGLQTFLQDRAELTLDVVDNGFVFCGQRVEESGQTRDLAADFTKARIEGITVKHDFSRDELASFLRLITLKPELAEQKGGLKKLLQEAGVVKIALADVKYARISEDETITKSDDAVAADPESTAAAASPDMVGAISAFLAGESPSAPPKENLALEFKKHARRVVRQLLKLVGPQKAVEEIIQLIAERFEDIGFSDEDAAPMLDKARVEILKVREPKQTKRDIEKQLKALLAENEALKTKLENIDELVQEQVAQRTAELQQENKKIKRERAQINAVLRNVAEGLVIVDNNGKVLLLNPAAERLIGNKEQKIGTHILDGLNEQQMVSYTKDKPQEIEIQIAGASQAATRTLRASSAVVENEDGQPVGMVSVLSDITRQKEINQMKDVFISHVSHELRAPLISIQKSLSLFLETAGTVSPDQKHFLEIAGNNAQRLSRLVNDLLDVAKLEAGKMRPEFENIPAADLTAEVFEMIGAWAESRGVVLRRAGVEGVSFSADRKMFNQILTNLIGNAIKFTPRGGTVTVSCAPMADMVELRVQDTGCGIPADSLARIFEKFEQTRNMPAEGSPKGSGLGLSIVKEMVVLHGGRVWAESDGKNGSCFIVHVPNQPTILDSRD